MTPEPLRLSLSEDDLTTVAMCLSGFLECGDLVALYGDLGAGKTTFARALIRALVGDPSHEVPSPTFALRQDYASARAAIAHFDFYRIGSARDLDELGFDEALATSITIVEWPERAENALPADRIDISITESDTPTTRHVTLSGLSAVAAAAVAANSRKL